MACEAGLEGDHYVLNGAKTWISNGGIADFYCVFARTGEAPGARGISAFVVDADTPGFSIGERIELIAPHPLATIRFDNCRIPVSQRLGEPGQGFKLAMMTLDIFRASVAAAALGDRKSTRLNSSHTVISYAVFCLKKKKNTLRCAISRYINTRPR